jgi:hypothetical protein
MAAGLSGQATPNAVKHVALGLKPDSGTVRILHLCTVASSALGITMRHRAASNSSAVRTCIDILFEYCGKSIVMRKFITLRVYLSVFCMQYLTEALMKSYLMIS